MPNNWYIIRVQDNFSIMPDGRLKGHCNLWKNGSCLVVLVRFFVSNLC